MNYTTLKKHFYSHKYRSFVNSIRSLSQKQKGEFLLAATRDKNFDLVCLLSEFGAPINYADKNGTTGLMVVAQNVYNNPDPFVDDRNLDYKLAKFFLDKMTNDEINAQDKVSFHTDNIIPPYALPLLNTFTIHPHRHGGVTALMYLAAHMTNTICVELETPRLENGVYIKTELVEDTRVQDLICLFRAYGAQTNIKDAEGFDCLKYAIEYSNIDATKALLTFVKPYKNSVSQPSNIDAQDIFGNTAYMYASSKHKVAGLLELLEEYNANPNLYNNRFELATDVASKAWATEHVKEYTEKYNSRETLNQDFFEEKYEGQIIIEEIGNTKAKEDDLQK